MLDILGDKWTFLIIRDIALADKHFYREFLKGDEGIATNILSNRLKVLLEFEIIKSEPYLKNKTMKYYSLTEKGIEFIPLIIEAWIWGAKFDPLSSVPQEELIKRESMKDEIIKNLQTKLRNQL